MWQNKVCMENIIPDKTQLYYILFPHTAAVQPGAPEDPIFGENSSLCTMPFMPFALSPFGNAIPSK